MAIEVSRTQLQAAFAIHRFGLGPRPGTIAAIAGDPQGALRADLARDAFEGVAGPALPDSGEAARAAFAFQRAQREARQAKPPASAVPAAATPDAQAMNARPAPAAPQPGPGVPQQIYLADAKARFNAAIGCDLGFRERLVWFWSNHFCVSIAKNAVRPLAGAFEREAIRPHVTGRFVDLLLAVESHPAMLIYLDNAASIGPHSVAGLRSGKGLNENLAREILELHTLGVRSVYSQSDVTNFAKVITGWTVVPARLEEGGTFTFNRRMHEPGAQSVIGKVYDAAAMEQGRAVLEELARHPATAQHIATKLARHFVADDPPPALVEHLTRSFLDTDGDLHALALELIAAPQSWDTTHRKLKKPGEWLVASMRASQPQAIEDARPLLNAQALLGEPLWNPPAPNGFADTDAAWLDGLSQRLDLANRMARAGIRQADPALAVEDTLGALASPQTVQAVKRAESRPQALALLLMSPEFLRR